MTRYIKVWIEADRMMPEWQASYRNSPEKSEKEVLSEIYDHDEVQGMFALNYLIEQGGKLISTLPATTGGVCTGIVALVEVNKG